MNALLEATPAGSIELEEPQLQTSYGDLLEVEIPDYFDPIAHCYEDADCWSWASPAGWQ